jgi:TPR repeat protein
MEKTDDENEKKVNSENYLMSSNKGDNMALYNLGSLYEKQNKLDLAEKFYLMSSDKGDSMAMYQNKGIFLESFKCNYS